MADSRVKGPRLSLTLKKPCRVLFESMGLFGAGPSGDVYFHYTSELAFQNITHASKAVAEVWASLTTEGPHANAWWGKGVYSVPLQPHDWHDREELLDNNFRNMMKRRSSDWHFTLSTHCFSLVSPTP